MWVNLDFHDWLYFCYLSQIYTNIFPNTLFTLHPVPFHKRSATLVVYIPNAIVYISEHILAKYFPEASKLVMISLVNIFVNKCH